MDVVKQSKDFDSISWSTRMHLSQQMYELMELLHPYMDGSMGDVSPAMVNVYLKAAQQLGHLWDATKRPFEEKQVGIPEARVQRMLQEQQELHEKQLQAAVIEATQRGRDEVLAVARERERLSLEQGRDAVRRHLGAVAVRRS